MKIEVGKKYLDRVGGVIEILSNDGFPDWPFCGDNGCTYTESGSQSSDGRPVDPDLISEYTPEAPKRLNDATPEEWDEVIDITGSALDTQVGGDHYKEFEIEPVEFILRNKLTYLQGNVIKYICRYPFKGGAEDLKKAIHYLELQLELVD